MNLDSILENLNVAATLLGTTSYGFDEDTLVSKQLVMLEKYLYEVIQGLDDQQDLETLFVES